MPKAPSTESPRPDVALYIPSYAGGGAERVAFFVARALADAGLRVDLVVACAKGPLRDAPLSGVNKVELGAPNELLAAPAWIRYLKRAHPRCAISMVHTANFNSGIGAYFVPEVPVIVSLHYALVCEPEAQWWLRRTFGTAPERSLYRRVARVIGVSQGLANEAAELFELPPHKVAAIYNPREPGRDAGGIAEHHEPIFEKPVVISAGRLAPQKDYATLLRAFAEVADARDLHLLILGKGPDRAALEAQAKKLGIEQRVFMPGFVDSPAAYMRRARAYAMSSRNEGFPMVLIEALESGTAIVSTDCHWGPREVLDGGRFGRLVPVGDAQALAAAIRDELDSDDPGPEARRSERAEWMRQYEPAVIARQYVDLVRAVIAESEPKAGDEGSS